MKLGAVHDARVAAANHRARATEAADRLASHARHVSANAAFASSTLTAKPRDGFTIAPVTVHIQGRSSGMPARGLKIRPMSRPSPSWLDRKGTSPC
jgi:hypothetical protein